MSLHMDHESWDRISLLCPGCIPRLFYSLCYFLYSLTNNSRAPRCSSAWQSSDTEFQLLRIPALNLFWGVWFVLENCWKTTSLGLLVSAFCAASCIVDKPARKWLQSSALCPILQHSLNTDCSRPEQKVTLQSLEFLSKGRTAASSMFFDIY